MEVYWFEQTIADVPIEDDWLGAREIRQLERFRIPKRRDDWRLGRWTAKRALALFFQFPPEAVLLASVEIIPASSGEPVVFFSGVPAPVTISLSHSAGRSACCIMRGNVAVGCDLEVVERRSEVFVSDYFTEEEQQTVAGTPVLERSRLVTLIWSAKESALKALREGLRLDTRKVNVRLESTRGRVDSWSAFEARTFDRVFHGWWRYSGGIVRTIAAEPFPDEPTELHAPADLNGSDPAACELFKEEGERCVLRR